MVFSSTEEMTVSAFWIESGELLDVDLLQVAQDAVDGVGNPGDDAGTGGDIGVFRRPVDRQGGIALRVEVIRLDVGRARHPLEAQAHPQPLPHLPLEQLAVDLFPIGAEGVGGEGHAHQDVALLGMVFLAHQGHFGDLADLHAAEFHRRADFQPLHRVLEIGLHQHLLLEQGAGAEGDDAEDQQGAGADDEQADLEVIGSLFQRYFTSVSPCWFGPPPRGSTLPPEELPDIGIAAVAQLPGLADGDDPAAALVEHDHPVGDIVDAGQLMGDDDEGDPQAAGQLQDKLVEFGRGDRVQPGRRLVEKEDLRIEGHRPGDPRPLLHPAAELAGQVIGIAAQPDQAQLHHGDQFAGGRRQMGQLLHGEADVLQQGHRAEQRPALVGDADPAQDLLPLAAGGGDDVLRPEEDPPPLGLQQADHVFQQGALPRAGPSQDDEDLPPVDLEGDILQDQLLLVAGGQVLHPDDAFPLPCQFRSPGSRKGRKRSRRR